MSFKKRTAFFASLLVVAALVLVYQFAAPVPGASAQGQAGTTLTATVDASIQWTRTFHWTIDKSVSPGTLDLFRGDSGSVQYTVAVTKDDGTDQASISGTICVTNGGSRATEGLAIVAELRNGVPPPNDLIASAGVDVSGNAVLDPGETGCYPYSFVLGSPHPYPGGTYKVTANVTITNHSGHLGEPFGPSPSASTNAPAGPTLIHDSVTVNDTNGGSWQFGDDGQVSYDVTFTCDGDEGTHNNTATITYNDDQTTGPSDSASVTVNCYALTVTKDANTSYTRTWEWTIAKQGDQTDLTLATGEVFQVNYTVTLGATATDSDFAVSGNIWISNPAPMDAPLTAVSDVVSPDIAADVDCPSLTVPAGGSLHCTYSASLPDADPRTNTATATLQNTPGGTTDFSGSANVAFGDPTEEVDECVDVSDDQYGFLGTVCAGDADKTFEYALNVGPYEVCGSYEFTNVASFETNDTGATGSDSHTVNVNVPCGGCTLTPGYWKTHSIYGPAAHPDDGWAAVGGPDAPFFLSGKTWLQVLWTPPAGGNAYYILAHAYIAAKLNILNGTASTPQVDAAIAFAEGFFATKTPSSSLTKQQRQQVLNNAGILDAYNNGFTGPGHCDEQP